MQQLSNQQINDISAELTELYSVVAGLNHLFHGRGRGLSDAIQHMDDSVLFERAVQLADINTGRLASQLRSLSHQLVKE